MTNSNGRRRLLPGVFALAAAVFAVAGESSAKLETWRQESAAGFAKHRREGVVVSDEGRVRLARALAPTFPLAADRVWDLARAADGSIFAATGDDGRVFRLAAKDAKGWEQILDHADGQILSLAATSDGKVFAGTGPSGKVVELTDPAHPESRSSPDALYVWDLAADSSGNLFAATGPKGRLWKRSAAGAWTLVYDARPAHLLSVAVGPDGSVFAGSDGEGLIFRVAPDGKASVLYDAPQSEVRTLLAAADGSLYAGTAADAENKGINLFSTMRAVTDSPSPLAGEGGPQGRMRGDVAGSLWERNPSSGLRPPSPTRGEGIDSRGLASEPVSRASRVRAVSFVQDAAKPAAGGAAAPKPAAGENAVYRIEPSGVVREVFRVRALVNAIARIDGRLLVGTGPDGALYEVREDDGENAAVAKLDSGQILALLAEPDGGLLIGAGDPGAVVRLSPDFVEKGETVSDVLDAKLPSRFGSVSWQGDAPEGTSIALQVRSGNVGEPDATWSDWSAERSDATTAAAGVPVGRFVQYRARLATKDPKRSPELRSVAIAYRSINLAPEIAKLDVPDVSTADAAARQTKIAVQWEASDPNGDDLDFVVKVRKEGWPDWIALTAAPIREKTYSWDASAFPSGRYRVKLIAGDRPSNGPAEALESERESGSFLVDREPPRIGIAAEGRKATIKMTDDSTRLTKAEYAVDGGAWASIFPDDGLFDSTSETTALELPELKPGVHLLMIRATDAAGNVGAGDAVLTVKD